MNGHQRWYCKECGHIFVRRYALSDEVLYTDYLFGKQTIQQLAVVPTSHVGLFLLLRRVVSTHTWNCIYSHIGLYIPLA